MLHNLYASLNIIMVIKLRMRCVWHVAHMGEMIYVYSILDGEPEGKRLLGKPRHRWEHHIRMVLRETGWEGVYWINVAQYRDQ
jgi:hypothetical protein